MCVNNQPSGVTEGLLNIPERGVVHFLQEFEGRGYEKFSWELCPQTPRASFRKWPSPNSNTGSAPVHTTMLLEMKQNNVTENDTDKEQTTVNIKNRRRRTEKRPECFKDYI